MGTRITERSKGLLVTVISEDGASTETYSFDRDDRPAHFADLANTLDMVLMKVGAPLPEVGRIKQRVLNEPPKTRRGAFGAKGEVRATQKAIV